MRVAKFQA